MVIWCFTAMLAWEYGPLVDRSSGGPLKTINMTALLIEAL